MDISRWLRSLPPLPAMLAILALATLVPLFWYVNWSVRDWQFGGSPADALTIRYFAAIAIGRSLGAVILAVLLFFWRRPVTVAVTITAIWLAGPPVSFLWVGIQLLAISAGQVSWPNNPLAGLQFSIPFPLAISVLLLAFRRTRQAYGF